MATKTKKKKEREVINYNSYENAQLSAMWPAPYEYKGIYYKCCEQHYAFMKLDKSEEEKRNKIMSTYDPYNMKYQASSKAKGKVRKDHDTKAIDVMRIAIRESYMQNPHRLLYLLNTGDAYLNHRADWDDKWGDGKNGKGANMHGILTMEFRDKMKGVDVWDACRNHKIKEAK